MGFDLKSSENCYFSPDEVLKSFHRSSNCIIRAMKRPNEVVLLHLLYSNCVTILTYGCDVREFGQREFVGLNTAVNSYIRKIFSFKFWQSTRFIREFFGYRSLTELFALAKNRFHRSISNSSNSIVKKLYAICNS